MIHNRFTRDEVSRAIAYWRPVSPHRYVHSPEGILVSLPNGHVIVDEDTVKRGARLLAEWAERRALGEDYKECEIRTPHGIGYEPQHPGRILNDFAQCDSNALDLVVQMGAFGCLIFA